MSLSKSLFIRGYQCIKSYYLHRKRPYLRDKLSSETIEKFQRGHHFDKIVQQLFPGGQLVWKGGAATSLKMQQKVQTFIMRQQSLLYQVPFFVNDLLAIADVVKNETGKWIVYEVKSSSSLKEVFWMDMAFQAFVVEKFGLSPVSFRLLYLRECFENIQDHFSDEHIIILDADKEVSERRSQVIELIETLREVEKMKHSPEISVGRHCIEPYQCDFIGHCWRRPVSEVVSELREQNKS